MRRFWIAILMMSIGLGCTSDRLRWSTLNQATTLSDLQFQQVLSNIAMFSQNPSAMPWHVNLRDGSAQVADLGSAMIGGNLTRTSAASPSLLGARTVVEQWSMTPVTDDTELRILRVAYRRALGYNESLGDDGNDLANELAHELKKQTPDFNEFQDQISRMFEDGKTRYRNNQFKKRAYANTFYPYKYLVDAYADSEKDLDKPAQPEERTYIEFLERAMSVVNERIIVDDEEITDGKRRVTGFEIEDGKQVKKYRYIPYFNNYSVDEKYENEYGHVVNLVTPFAAELRRQVKEVQLDMLKIQGGWFHVGTKKDVPHDACYVGHYRDCYAWVCRDGLEDLTQFTLKILNFSSLLKDPTITSTPGPRFTPASGFTAL